MRNKNTHSLTIKGKLNKKKGVFVAFNQLQFKYGQLLDKDDEIVEIQANYSLKDFSFGNNYTSDFVCKKSNGELKIRDRLTISASDFYINDGYDLNEYIDRRIKLYSKNMGWE